ncbi:MAG: hypothetical protein H6581_16760 [Bacteroidia bacterium]|nr:hypothetical protein [Bacteroidia bacterium]
MNYLVKDSLAQTIKDNIVKCIAQIEKDLPFLLQLEPWERASINSVSKGRQPFLFKCATYIDQRPKLFPSFLDKTDYRNAYDTYLYLHTLLKRLRPLLEMIEDTEMLAGAETFHRCLAFHHNTKLAKKNGFPGADSVHDDLAIHWGSPNVPTPEEFADQLRLNKPANEEDSPTDTSTDSAA